MGRVIVKCFFIMALVLFNAVSVANAQEKREFKPWHAAFGGECSLCHKDDRPKANALGDFKCASCHGTAKDMAQQTAGLGKMNPHTSIHFETNLPCEECHKEHQKPYNYCAECHRTWPNTIPGKR